jgi:ABC transporter substrate binding protein
VIDVAYWHTPDDFGTERFQQLSGAQEKRSGPPAPCPALCTIRPFPARSVAASPGLQRGVDVIVTASTAATMSVKKVTSMIPIVFASAGDPVRTGLVASLAHPGGNVTGLSNMQTDLGGLRLELLRNVVPALNRVAVLGNVDSPLIRLEMEQVQAAAAQRLRRQDSSRLEARRPPRPAAAQVRSGLQRHDREGARFNHPRIVFGARHRNDRMIFQLQFPRRQFLHGAAASLGLSALPRLACAQL